MGIQSSLSDTRESRDLSLSAVDIVRIEIDQVGVLTNPVVSVGVATDPAQ